MSIMSIWQRFLRWWHDHKNPPPPPPGKPTAGFAVSFNGLAVSCLDMSTDVGSYIASEIWEWGDGNASVNVAPGDQSHTYAKAGTYTITQTVTDATDQSDSVSHSVTVSDNAPPPEKYNIGAEQAGGSFQKPTNA